jgi:hypothetical protein
MRLRSSFLLLSRFCCILALPLVLLLSPQSVLALDVTLAWDRNIEPGIGGYKVFMRQEGQDYDYRRHEWVGRRTSCTIHNLDDEANYCFVVRAFGKNGAESGDSNEACTYYTGGCGGSAEASGYGANPVYRPSDLGMHLACLLLPPGALIGLAIWWRKR